MLVVSGWAPWAWITGGISLVVGAALLRVRRVLLGEDWVAVRQIGRFHIATVDHVKHLELRPSEHGGVLCLHTDDGRCMRLRRVEVIKPEVNAALRELAGRGNGTHDSRVEELLMLTHDDSRIRHRYLADAVQ